MKKRLIIALTLLVLFSTYKPHKLFMRTHFNIVEIKIDNNFILQDDEIKKDLFFLYDTNLFFLKMPTIRKILKKNTFIESFEIKKIYPNKIKVTIFEKKPIAILQSNETFFYISENIDLIDYKYLEDYKNLPIILGNKNNFELLYKKLKKINFPINLIKRYYLHESNRWDLITYKNKTIKLPFNNYTKNLENFMILNQERSFDKYKVFDYRINNQLILK